MSIFSIQKQHAVVTNEGGEIVLKPGSSGAKIKVNGVPLMGSRPLQHLDRVIFGKDIVIIITVKQVDFEARCSLRSGNYCQFRELDFV